MNIGSMPLGRKAILVENRKIKKSIVNSREWKDRSNFCLIK